MKTRTGFVSNSSSSSFVVPSHYLTEMERSFLLGLDYSRIGSYQDQWDITEQDGKITGYCSMDNGCKEDGLFAVLKKNGFPMGRIKWEWN